MSKIRIVSAAVALLAPFLSSAQADTKTFQPSSGDWSTGSNWSPSGVPSATTRVVIPIDKTCNLGANATADTLDVDGVLNIGASYTLTLENNNDNVAGPPGSLDHSNIDGEVNLEYSGAGGAVILITTNSHIVTGAGKIRGANVACKIRITSSKTFTNDLDPDTGGIFHSMTFENTGAGTAGTFRNEGVVSPFEAEFDEGYDMVFANNLNLSDEDGALWIVACFCSMTFNRESLNMAGDWWTFGAGPFVFNATLRTCGTYIGCGNLDVNNSATFEYASFSSSFCSNPADSGTGGCGDPYVVSADINEFYCAED